MVPTCRTSETGKPMDDAPEEEADDLLAGGFREGGAQEHGEH